MLYFKDLKLSVFVIALSKLVPSFIFWLKPLTPCCFRIIWTDCYIGITRFKFSAFFVIQLMNGPQFLNATGAAIYPAIVIFPFTNM